MIKVTNENYFLTETKDYKSVSQIKTAMSCEARWFAEHEGRYKRDLTEALALGSYADAVLTDKANLAAVKNEYYDLLYTAKGKQRSGLVDLEKAVLRAQSDLFFMSCLAGEHQLIIQIEDFHGHKFKCKLDDLNFDECTMSDLKTCRDLSGEEWTQLPNGKFGKIHWIYFWKYHLQAAMYREAVYQKYGFRPAPLIPAIQKGKIPDIEVFDLSTLIMLFPRLIEGTLVVMDRMDAIKSGEIPFRCESCDYCKLTKVLTAPTKIEIDERIFY